MQVKKEAPRKLRGQMLVLGISQRQLAEKIGHRSHTYLGRIMRGEVKSVDPTTATAIAASLNLPLDDLFFPQLSTSPAHIVTVEETAA